MSLDTYQTKRRFERTPEPKGKPQRSAGVLRFVVQKHHARRLHYDLRLEMDGVLKSWAVPKGPSLDPTDKRLAVQVEDHPLEYRTFEGTIPKGNYGAGTVMVWDEGTYEPIEPTDPEGHEKILLEQLQAGQLKLRLHGKKLKGEFALVRMKGDGGKNWLLIKHRDQGAANTDVLKQEHSVLSMRSMAEIAGNADGPVWHSNRTRAGGATAVNASPGAEHPGAAKTSRRPSRGPTSSPMPHNVKPMLASPVDQPFDRPGWFFEIKWDGYRAIAEVEGGKVRTYSRRLLSYDKQFPAVAEALADFGHDAVLDGEIVAVDHEGKSRFQLLQGYQKSGKGNLLYYVFDLLYLDGHDLRDEPLRRRKELLAPLIGQHGIVRLSEHIEEHGVAFLQAAARQGLEGIVAKNSASSYRPGIRSQNWLKIKTRKRQEAVIGGFTEPRGSRRGLGALMIGVYEGDGLVYAGRVGTGFDAKSLLDLRARLDRLEQKKSPFTTRPKADAPVHWVQPVLVAEVEFLEWSRDGHMREPAFQGLREDKPARSVRREVVQPVEAAVAQAELPQTQPQGTKQERFTNLDKVYWPDEGYTKGDSINYYREVAPVMVPHLRDRPLSLNRHPNGIRGKNFFQKDVARQPPPDWVKTVEIDSETRGEKIRYMVCQDEATLLYMANLGCIEINPWNSRIEALDAPDYLIIDLDPQGVPFGAVIETAQHVHKLLAKHGAECYCKTSGKRGLHLYLPLAARYPYDLARQFAEIVARKVHEELPQTTSVARSPAQRRNQVYLDFLQNRRGQTVAAPYSLRPVEGARVSTPLRWQEVTKKLDPAKFTIKTMPRRLDKLGDLWQPVLGKGVDLEKCLRDLTK